MVRRGCAGSRCREVVTGVGPRRHPTTRLDVHNKYIEEDIIRRRRRNQYQRDDDAHRANKEIRISPIRVIDPDGEQLGVMSADEGREKAAEYGLDLVEVAPKARPPVCRIMDYGKFKYEQSKKKSNSNASKVELKTVRFRPNTGDHDLDTKLNNAQRFLKKGNKVKLVMRMRGRERAYTNRWVDYMHEVLERLEDDYGEELHVLNRPKSEQDGRQVTVVVEPGH